MTGIVVSFDEKRGFGFIRAECEDYFFHWKDIIEKRNRKMYLGERVTFDECTTVKGLSAANVRRYEGYD